MRNDQVFDAICVTLVLVLVLAMGTFAAPRPAAPIPLKLYVNDVPVECHSAIEHDVGMADAAPLLLALGKPKIAACAPPTFRASIVALVRLAGAAISMRDHRIDIQTAKPPEAPFAPTSGFHSPQWLQRHIDGSPKRP